MLALYRRRTVVRQIELGGVVCEVPELVIRKSFNNHRVSPYVGSLASSTRGTDHLPLLFHEVDQHKITDILIVGEEGAAPVHLGDLLDEVGEV